MSRKIIENDLIIVIMFITVTSLLSIILIANLTDLFIAYICCGLLTVNGILMIIYLIKYYKKIMKGK